MKKTILSMLLGTLIIGSCTQNEVENEQKIYRYSEEEIATLRSIAEKYGVSNIKFITSSQVPLPSIKEMEQTFIEFAVMKQIMAQPLETVDSTASSKIFKTKRMPQTRILKKSPEFSTNSIDLSRFIDALNENMRLTLKVTATKDKNAPNEDPKIEVYGSLELPDNVDNIFYEKKDEKAGTNWISKTSVGVFYSCSVYKYEIVNNIKRELASDIVDVNTSTGI